MKKLKKSLLALLTAAVMLSVMFAPKTAVKTDAADATTQSLQDQLNSLSTQIKEYEKQISDLSDQKASEMEIKANLDALSAVTQQKITTAEALSDQLKSQIETTTAGIAEKEEAIKTTFNKFLERMVVSYEEGDASYLSIILNSSDMADFLTKMDMVSSMLEYDRNLKIQYENERTELQAAKTSLEEAQELQSTVIDDLEADKANYELLSEQQANYIKTLEDDLSKANSAYEQAKAQENALDAELQAYLYQLAIQQQKLEEERRAQEAARAAQGNTEDNTSNTDASNVFVGGGFAWPLPGYSGISSGFGWRTLGGYSDYHRGIDIPAPSGTPIHASKGGQVLRAEFNGSYGNFVLIDHGNGESTLYAHQSMIGCSVGQYVNQGDVIGYVGTTGYSTGNHLHFEVRINGEPNNPLSYVSP